MRPKFRARLQLLMVENAGFVSRQENIIRPQRINPPYSIDFSLGKVTSRVDNKNAK